jgi:hypothetical protein
MRASVAALAVLATLVLAAPAGASTFVFVCGKDLCRSDERGRDRQRLTRDGAPVGGYSRPTIDRAGRRVAFKAGDPGRVFTADARLRRRTRIPPRPTAPATPRSSTPRSAPMAGRSRGSRRASTSRSAARTSAGTSRP